MRSSQHHLPEPCICPSSLQPHGCGYCSPKPHVPESKTSAGRLWSCWSLCALTGLCSPGCEHMEKHTESHFGLFHNLWLWDAYGRSLKSMPITSLFNYCYPPPSNFVSVYQSPYAKCLSAWNSVQNCLAVKDSLEGECVSCRCSVHTLPRGENCLPLGSLVQLPTNIKMWQGSQCLTVHDFSRLPSGCSLQPGNPKIEYPLSSSCYPPPLYIESCKSSY